MASRKDGSLTKTMGWHDLHVWQRDNEYILTGYRRYVSPLSYIIEPVLNCVDCRMHGQGHSLLSTPVRPLVFPTSNALMHRIVDVHNETGLPSTIPLRILPKANARLQ